MILPFIWIFNPQLLLIDVHGWAEVLLVAGASLLAMMAFAAITMNWMRVRCRLWELAALAAAVVFLFRPDFFMDTLADEYKSVPPAQVYAVAAELLEDDRLVAVIQGTTLEGKTLAKTVAVNLGDSNPDGRKRIAAAGLTLSVIGERVQVLAAKFGSPARKGGFDEGFDIVELKVPSGRASPFWFYLPGLALLALVWVAQGRRIVAGKRMTHIIHRSFRVDAAGGRGRRRRLADRRGRQALPRRQRRRCGVVPRPRPSATCSRRCTSRSTAWPTRTRASSPASRPSSSPSTWPRTRRRA